MKKLGILLASALTLLASCAQYNEEISPLTLLLLSPADWSQADFSRRRLLTFNDASTYGELSNVPIMVRLNSDRIDYELMRNDGADIRFTDSSGNLLSHEIETWNSSGNSTVWLKLPAFGSSADAVSTVWMYYSNSSAADVSDAASVWSSSYGAVWHMNGTPTGVSGDLNENTKGLSTTSTGGMSACTSPDDRSGGCLVFDGVDDFLSGTSTSDTDITGDVTITARIRLSALGLDHKIFSNQRGTAAGGGFKIGIFSDNKVEIEVRDNTNGLALNRAVTGGTVMATDTWYFVAGSYSQTGDYLRTYVNGSLDRELIGSGITLSTSDTALRIGSESTSATNLMNGIIDEVRVSNTIRSDGWLGAQNASFNDELIGTFGSMEKINVYR